MNLPAQNKTEYKAVNGCTKQFECEQIFWAMGMLTIIALYCAFTVTAIVKWDSAVLIVFMVITFVICLIMGYDYVVLTIADPVDERIKGVLVIAETKYCSICRCNVGVKTYHCIKCSRCTDELDHHSMLVNNCISLKNITNYLRMNISLILVVGIISTESLVIFSYSFIDSTLDGIILNKWIILAVGVCAFFVFPIAIFNLILSIYIRFNKNLAKIEYFYR
jgi:hypothetical protein